MNRNVLLGTLLLVLASVPSVAAKPDVPDVVNSCDGSNVCVVAGVDPACVGVGFGLQGVAACVRENCVHVVYGIMREPVCLESTAAPDGCDKYGICGGPFVVVNQENVCVGYANRYGGSATCLDRDEGVCFVSAGEFWYGRECTGQPVVLP